jgi:hypothetical protein
MNLLKAFIGSLSGHVRVQGDPNDATVLFGFSFGYAVDSSGHWMPGRSNEQIADKIIELSKKYDIRKIIAQEEVAAALRAKGLVVPDENILASFIPGELGQTYNTADMWRQAVERKLITALDVVMPVAQAYHLPRVLLLGSRYTKLLRVCENAPRDFFADSNQDWTTSLPKWRKHELIAYWRLWRS